MTTFLIDPDNNNITAHAEVPAGATPYNSFATQEELAKLTAPAHWAPSRLVDTWNSFAGVAPFDDLKAVKKFTDRKAAVSRIWNAVQRLAEPAAPEVATVATKKTKSKADTKEGKPTKAAPQNAKATKRAAKKTAAKKEIAAPAPREGSKKQQVIDLISSKHGATLAEIMAATDWQAHTVRGFMSVVPKKLGLTVGSSKNADGERTYKLA